MRTYRRIAVVAALAGLGMTSSTTAHAEGLLTGLVGMTFGGESSEAATTYGVAIGATAGGILGFELDLATTSDIFEDAQGTRDSSITTAMGNLMLGIGGPVRPYVTGGAGLIRSTVDIPVAGSMSQNDLGVNVGAGVIAFVTDHVGIRGDLRYFRAVDGDDDGALLDFDPQLGDLDFWRGSVGVTLGW